VLGLPSRRLLPYMLLSCLLTQTVATVARAQRGPAPEYTVSDVIAKLKAGVTVARMVTLVLEGCVSDGPLNSDHIERLRALGATVALFKAIDASRCAPPPSRRSSLPSASSDQRFALISAGSFAMGSTNGDADEQPVRVVTISRPFLLQRTEVTQEQWRTVMGSNPSYFSTCGPTCPVEKVGWLAVQSFLERLNVQDPGKNYRLPTEAEWEYAARAGTTGDFGVAGGVCTFAWVKECPQNSRVTRPVARGQPNAWGLFDMHGNVAEWVDGGYGPYIAWEQQDPRPANNRQHVHRGGSWNSSASEARSAFRGSHQDQGDNLTYVGFRLARSPQ
jgi:formylglycine-generating enzyme required for sulfatase activity